MKLLKDRNYNEEELGQIVKNLDEDYKGYLDALGELKKEKERVERCMKKIENIITAIDKELFVDKAEEIEPKEN